MYNANNRKPIGTRDRKAKRSVTQPNDVLQPTKDTRKCTLQQALTLFVRAKETEGVRPRTVREYINHIGYLSDYMTEVCGLQEAFVDDMSADVVRGYIKYMLTEKRRYATSSGRKDKTVGLSVNTVNIRLRTLRTMCRFWSQEGIVNNNAMENIKSVATDESEEVPGISDAEVDIILASFDETQFAEWRDKTLCLLLLDTGMRIQEACGLTMDRIDFRMMTAFVPSQVAKNRRNREVPVSREVAKLIRELSEESAGYFGEVDNVFITAYGDPLTPDAFRKRLNRRKKRLGMERLSPHMFRHTFCRKYILNGGDLFTLQKIVDHADINTTRKYIQMDTEHVRDQHNKYSPVRRLYTRK